MGEICQVKRGTPITKKHIVSGKIPVIAGGRQPAYFHNASNRTGPTIVVAGSGAYAGWVSWWDKPVYVSDAFTISPSGMLNARYCFHWLKSRQQQLHGLKSGGGVPHVYPRDVIPLKIPVPSLAKQIHIVNILDTFDALTTSLTEGLPREIALRHQQYEYYRDLLLSFPEPEEAA